MTFLSLSRETEASLCNELHRRPRLPQTTPANAAGRTAATTAATTAAAATATLLTSPMRRQLLVLFSGFIFSTLPDICTF